MKRVIPTWRSSTSRPNLTTTCPLIWELTFLFVSPLTPKVGSTDNWPSRLMNAKGLKKLPSPRRISSCRGRRSLWKSRRILPWRFRRCKKYKTRQPRNELRFMRSCRLRGMPRLRKLRTKPRCALRRPGKKPKRSRWRKPSWSKRKLRMRTRKRMHSFTGIYKTWRTLAKGMKKRKWKPWKMSKRWLSDSGNASRESKKALIMLLVM